MCESAESGLDVCLNLVPETPSSNLTLAATLSHRHLHPQRIVPAKVHLRNRCSLLRGWYFVQLVVH